MLTKRFVLYCFPLLLFVGSCEDKHQESQQEGEGFVVKEIEESPADSIRRDNVLAFISRQMPHDFWEKVQSGAFEEAEENNIVLYFKAANQKQNPIWFQKKAINRFINIFEYADLEGIIIAPEDLNALKDELVTIKNKRLPLVLIGSWEDNFDYGSYIGADQVQAGQMAAKYLAKDMPKGAKVVIFPYNPEEESLSSRAKGVYTYFNEERPDIQLIEFQEEYPDAGFDNYFDIAIDIAKNRRDWDGIITIRKKMAMGIYRALQYVDELESKKIMTIGINKMLFEGIMEGRVHGAVASSAYHIGRKAVALFADSKADSLRSPKMNIIRSELHVINKETVKKERVAEVLEKSYNLRPESYQPDSIIE